MNNDPRVLTFANVISNVLNTYRASLGKVRYVYHEDYIRLDITKLSFFRSSTSTDNKFHECANSINKRIGDFADLFINWEYSVEYTDKKYSMSFIHKDKVKSNEQNNERIFGIHGH